jgi:holo-[acyl-carrier protein] synthase
LLNNAFGIGIDIVNISRFKKKPLKTNLDFYKKIFSETEIEYCKKFKSPYEHFAGKFALKEAVIKSINENVELSEIVTSHTNSKPTVKIKKLLKNKYDFMISISHEKEFAVAVAISIKSN